jgi:hypothetical protein
VDGEITIPRSPIEWREEVTCQGDSTHAHRSSGFRVLICTRTCTQGSRNREARVPDFPKGESPREPAVDSGIPNLRGRAF